MAHNSELRVGAAILVLMHVAGEAYKNQTTYFLEIIDKLMFTRTVRCMKPCSPLAS